jgi:hypothetical protein
MKAPSRIQTRRIVRLLTGVGLSTVLSLALADKVDMYAIGNWSGGSCAPGDTGLDRGSWPGMAQAWYDAMGAMGHTRTGKFVDGNMNVKRFCDPSVSGSCQDYSYVDWPDMAIVAANGFTANNGWGALMRESALGTCNTQMGGSGPSVDVGDGNLKFLHASSCLSLNDSYLSQMRASFKKAGAAKGLHVLTGFHGIMWISSSYNGDYSATAVAGHSTSVANAWTGHHYKSNKMACAAYDPFNFFGTCQDQCPVAMTVGPTGGSALNRLVNERYNNSAAFGPPSGNSYYAWMGYPGCDPVGAGPYAP